MHEPSTLAIRGKKDSSITVCTNLSKEGKVDAVVSAGHTGAAVASSVVRMRNLEGVLRPGIVTPSLHLMVNLSWLMQVQLLSVLPKISFNLL